MRHFALVFLLLPAPTAAAAGPLENVLEEARKNCESFEDGIFEPRDAVQPVDLTGDGVPEIVVDESRFSCSSAASMYCGTGGCMLRAIVGDQTFSWLAKGWEVVDWAGDRILLLQIHGANCGGTNLRRCYEAVVWTDDRFASVRPNE
jgi:hypothetical protein